jgi:hypothetical protein
MIQHFAERDGTTVLVSQPEPGYAAGTSDAIHGLGKQQLMMPATNTATVPHVRLSWQKLQFFLCIAHVVLRAAVLPTALFVVLQLLMSSTCSDYCCGLKGCLHPPMLPAWCCSLWPQAWLCMVFVWAARGRAGQGQGRSTRLDGEQQQQQQLQQQHQEQHQGQQ